jgi:hypothetical protein
VAKRHVEMIVRRNGRQEDRVPAVVDVRDVSDMQTELVNWLIVNRWPERHWASFTADFHTGEGRPVTVHAVV